MFSLGIRIFTQIPTLFLLFVGLCRSADLHGLIFNSDTGQAIPGVSVYLEETQQGTMSDEDGNFDFLNLDHGTYTVVVKHIAFDEEKEIIKLLNTTVLNITYYLVPKMLNMASITTTANRQQSLISESASIIQILNSDDLRIRNSVRTIPEALQQVPGVMVQKTAHGQGSPYIRGFTGFRNLFLIDGIRLNNSVFREGPNQYWNTVDQFSVGRIEILKGPGSVLYGSDAIGGVVQVLTPVTRSSSINGLPKGQMYFRLSSAENSIVQRFEINGNVNKLFYSGGITVKDFGDLEGGKDVGTQPKTGYSEIDADCALSYNINSSSTVKAVYQTVNQDDVWRTHKTIYGISWEGTSTGNEKKRSMDQDRDLFYIRYQNRLFTQISDNLIITLSYHHQEETRDRIKSSGSSEEMGLSVDTKGLNLQIEKSTTLAEIVYGIDSYFDDVNSHKYKFNSDGSLNSVAIQGAVADNSEYKSLGFFLQGKIGLLPNWDVSVGTRYDINELNADNVALPPGGVMPLGGILSINDDWSQFTSNIKTSYALSRSPITVFAGISQSYRAPNLSDLTRYDFARSNEVEIPVFSLDPEEFTSFDVGFKMDYENFYCETGIYYTKIHSMIVRVPTGIIDDDGNMLVTKKNSGKGHVSGLETTVSLDITSNLSLFGFINLLSGELSTYPTSHTEMAEEPLSRLLPMAGSTGIRWHSTNEVITCEAILAFAGKADQLSTRDKGDTQRIPQDGTPGYKVLNISSTYKVNKSLSISCSMENVCDIDYRIHGSGLNEAGRNIVLTSQFKF